MILNIFQKKWPEISIDEIRKRSRILVIDDSEFPYLPLFKKDEYQIEKWDDIEDLTKLEDGYYDLILLDIQGVGKDRSSEQGLGILKHIHTINPAQIIIAFSSADYSLKYHEFFQMADVALPKSTDYYSFKRTVDKLLCDRFSLGFYVDRICRIAGDKFQNDQALKKLAQEAILTSSTKKLEEYLKKIIDHAEIIVLAIKVAKAGAELLGTIYS